MKRQIVMVIWLISTASTAYANPPMIFPSEKLDACEVNCTCKAFPGQVDRCARYWTFIQQRPAGTVKRVVNPDPAACATAVDDNISGLAKHFGEIPEISLPTKEMATKAATLTHPPQAPLAYSRQLEAAASVSPNDPLDMQIVVQTSRVRVLTDDARSYTTVGGTVSKWQSAGAAAKRLAARTEGAEEVLSLARPWPTLREFAPRVWRLSICSHGRPAEVASLDARMLDESDIAWNFAFWDDWVVLRDAFDPDSAATDFEPPRFESISNPFFAEPQARVKERMEKSLFTLLELREFRSAVIGVAGGIDTYSQYLIDQAAARRSELEQSLDEELATVTRIRDLFKAEQAEVMRLKDSAEAAAAEMARVQASIENFGAEISAGMSSLQRATATRDQRRTARKAALSDLTAARAAVDIAQERLQSVALSCAGQSYEACDDAAAKKDYDQRRYEANKAVASARTAVVTAQGNLRQTDSGLLANEKEILKIRESIAMLQQRLKDQQESRETQEKHLAECREQLQAGEEKLRQLTGPMSKLDGAVEALGKVRLN
jgi:hypothetical protein